MTALIYDRKTGKTEHGIFVRDPGGTWGSITLKSLCDTLEKFGGVNPGDKVTHLVIEDGTISYRVEPRGGRS